MFKIITFIIPMTVLFIIQHKSRVVVYRIFMPEDSFTYILFMHQSLFHIWKYLVFRLCGVKTNFSLFIRLFYTSKQILSLHFYCDYKIAAVLESSLFTSHHFWFSQVRSIYSTVHTVNTTQTYMLTLTLYNFTHLNGFMNTKC